MGETIQAKGRDGTVTFDGQWLTITRSGFMALGRGGRGNIRLHIGQVTGVEIRKPGLTVGHFTVIAPGGQVARFGMGAHNQNPLSVMIASGGKLPPFERLRDAIEQAIAARSAPAAPANGVDIAGQLAHLAQLHQQGVLTDAEFAAAKQRLLGGGA